MTAIGWVLLGLAAVIVGGVAFFVWRAYPRGPNPGRGWK